jgi:uncharacterized protein (DUF924 family)
MRLDRWIPRPVALSRSASEEPEDKDAIAVLVLLEFLLGSSMTELRDQYDFESDAQAEELVRSAILKSGYDAQVKRKHP